MNADIKKATEEACKRRVKNIRASGRAWIWEGDHDSIVAKLTRAMARLSEQRDNCHKRMLGDNYMAHDNIENANAEIIEILTGDAE